MLEDAIHEINNHNASGLSFEELYRCCLPPRKQWRAQHACFCETRKSRALRTAPFWMSALWLVAHCLHGFISARVMSQRVKKLLISYVHLL